jgi:hypothetical protein
VTTRHRFVIVCLALALSLSGAPARRSLAAQGTPQPLTSGQLIDRALEAKAITDEIAHKYRVFAAFGDTRLPAPYKGTGAGPQVSPQVVDAAARSRQSFSAQTQADLAPFFARPADPGSWVTLPTVNADPAAPNAPVAASRGNRWETVPAVGGRVKVWAQTRYPGDIDKARAIAAEMTSRIWPTLVRRFWQPLQDSSYQRFSLGVGRLEDYDVDEPNGGGPEFDIYLVHFPSGAGPAGGEVGGTAPAADPPFVCGENPRYILLESRRPLGGAGSVGILNSLAHEFMHAISHAKRWQDADCAAYTWILEATGKWSEDFVYPDAQSEHPKAPDFLDQPYLSLDTPSQGAGLGGYTQRHYGTYLFPFYLAHAGQEAAVPAMWQQFESHTPLAGINAALRAGGTSLEEAFPKFAVANWNQPPVDDYQTKDKLSAGAKMLGSPIQVATPGGAVFSREIPINLHYLAASYHHFIMDASVKVVTFTNTLEGNPNASIWGLEKIKGQWDTTELTAEAGKTWCRDNAAEDLEELVIVFSNKAWPKTPVERRSPDALDLKTRNPPLLKAFPTGCHAWVGTIMATLTQDEPTFGAMRQTARTSIRFESDSSLNIEGNAPEYWKATLATIHWTVDASGGRCTGSFGGTFSVTRGGDDNPPATLRIWDPGDGGGLRHGGWHGPLPDAVEPTVTYNCGAAPPLTGSLTIMGAWFGTDPAGHAVSQDGKTLGGSFERIAAVSKFRWTWTLRPGP